MMRRVATRRLGATATVLALAGVLGGCWGGGPGRAAPSGGPASSVQPSLAAPDTVVLAWCTADASKARWWGTLSSVSLGDGSTVATRLMDLSARLAPSIECAGVESIGLPPPTVRAMFDHAFSRMAVTRTDSGTQAVQVTALDLRTGK